MSSCLSSFDRGSASLDWTKPLSEEKSDTFLHVMEQLENSYSMFSVNLDEALGMRRTGRLSKAYQLLHVSPDLCHRLAGPLLNSLRAMREHAKEFGTAPNLAPLDPENFHSSRGQRAALINALISRVVTRRSQFLHKVNALSELVAGLDKAFGAGAELLGNEGSIRPDRDWARLDAVHYDLNTCLREAAVLLKSFLHVLPAGQLPRLVDGLRKCSFPLPFSQLVPGILPVDGWPSSRDNNRLLADG